MIMAPNSNLPSQVNVISNDGTPTITPQDEQNYTPRAEDSIGMTEEEFPESGTTTGSQEDIEVTQIMEDIVPESEKLGNRTKEHEETESETHELERIEPDIEKIEDSKLERNLGKKMPIGLWIDGIPGVAMLDSGADVSLMSEEAWIQWRTRKQGQKQLPKLQRSTMKLSGADGAKLTVIGKVNLRTSIEEENKICEWIVVRGLGTAIILGVDLLRRFGIKVDFGNTTVDGSKHSAGWKDNSNEIQLPESLTLEARSGVTIMILMMIKAGKEVIITGLSYETAKATRSIDQVCKGDPFNNW